MVLTCKPYLTLPGVYEFFGIRIKDSNSSSYHQIRIMNITIIFQITIMQEESRFCCSGHIISLVSRQLRELRQGPRAETSRKYNRHISLYKYLDCICQTLLTFYHIENDFAEFLRLKNAFIILDKVVTLAPGPL